VFKGKKVLELGCGFDPLHPPVDCMLHSVDVRPECNPTFCCNILDGIPVKDGSYDIVFSSHFLEHFREDAVNRMDFDEMNRVLAEVERVLAPAGVLIALMPSPHSGMAVAPDHKSVYDWLMWCAVFTRKFVVNRVMGVGTWVCITPLMQFFTELAVRHPFFGREYLFVCSKRAVK
jgi:SAM-dependent methyltransferase